MPAGQFSLKVVHRQWPMDANGTFIIIHIYIHHFSAFAEAAETELLLMAFRPLNKLQFSHIYAI